MKKNPLEWSVFGVGLALLVALVGYLAVLSTGAEEEKAAFRVQLGQPEPVQGGYRTPVTVHNVSGATTRAVKVKVGDADLDFDYVPRHSNRKGFAVTEKPPKEGAVTSWQAP